MIHERTDVVAQTVAKYGKDRSRLMDIALIQLPAQYREVLRLRYLEGKPREEVAASMGRTVQAVHGLIKRAKQQLRDSLGHASAYLSSM